MAIDGVTSCMKIREVNKNKKQFISLLLLADEQESMVDRYLEKGTMYVLEDNDVKVLLPMKVMEYLKSRISQSIRKIRERAMAKH